MDEVSHSCLHIIQFIQPGSSTLRHFRRRATKNPEALFIPDVIADRFGARAFDHPQYLVEDGRSPIISEFMLLPKIEAVNFPHFPQKSPSTLRAVIHSRL